MNPYKVDSYIRLAWGFMGLAYMFAGLIIKDPLIAVLLGIKGLLMLILSKLPLGTRIKEVVEVVRINPKKKKWPIRL